MHFVTFFSLWIEEMDTLIFSLFVCLSFFLSSLSFFQFFSFSFSFFCLSFFLVFSYFLSHFVVSFFLCFNGWMKRMSLPSFCLVLFLYFLFLILLSLLPFFMDGWMDELNGCFLIHPQLFFLSPPSFPRSFLHEWV